MASPRNGFTPSRQPQPDWIRNVMVGAGGQPVCKGDAVVSNNGFIYAATAGQDPASVGYGVVLAVYTTANRPLTFLTPKFIASGQQGRADVCFDPNQTYVVQCVTSVGISNLGKNLMIDASAANATTGISGMSVDIPTSSSIADLFKLISLSPFEELSGKMGQTSGSFGGANNGVEVKWNNHFLHAKTANQ